MAEIISDTSTPSTRWFTRTLHGVRWRRGAYRLLVVLGAVWGGLLFWMFHKDAPTNAPIAYRLVGEIEELPGLCLGCNLSFYCPECGGARFSLEIASSEDVDAGAFDAAIDDMAAQIDAAVEKLKKHLQERIDELQAQHRALEAAGLKKWDAEISAAKADLNAASKRYNERFGNNSETFRAMSAAKAALRDARERRETKLRRFGIPWKSGIDAGVFLELAQKEPGSMQNDIQRLLATRGSVVEYKGRFAQESQQDAPALHERQFSFWLKPALIWLVSLLVLCGGIETVAWILRRLMPVRQ
jgi:hypothetical protein